MGTVFLRNNSWVIEYKLRNKTKRESIGNKNLITKTMAREVLKKREQQVKLGQLDMLDNEIPTFKSFSKDYVHYITQINKKRSWKRDITSIDHFGKLFNDKELSDITPGDIDDYKKIRLQKVKAGTVNRELNCIRYMFNLAKRWKAFFGDNPISISLSLRVDDKLERILSYKEEERLFQNCNEYLRDILTIALNTGMRRGEILNLRWEWLDFKNSVITLPQTHTKSQNTRKIPINSKLRTLLLKLSMKKRDQEYVFPSVNSESGHMEGVKRSFMSACKKAGIQGLRFHDLRHTAATRMIENGANIVAVSKILGHSDVKITMRYAHPEESLKEAVEKLANLNTQQKTHNQRV